MTDPGERSPDIALYPAEVMRYRSEHYWDALVYWVIRPLVDLTQVEFQGHDADALTRVAEGGTATFLFSNHISWADHFLIYYFMIRDKPYRGAAIAKEKYYKWPGAREVLRWSNQIPITNIKITFARWFHEQHGRAPTEADFVAFMEAHAADGTHEVLHRRADAMRQTTTATRAMLDRGRIILGYPEGTRSKTGRLQATKTGMMQLPLMLKGTIVPTAVWGTEKVLGRASHWWDFIKYFLWQGPTIHCHFGQGLAWDEALSLVEEKFAAREDPVNLHRLRDLRHEIEGGTFQAFTVEAARYERMFDEVALLVMRRINDLLPEPYRASDMIEVKYSRAP